MNERIRELADRACEYADYDPGYIPDKFLMKFVELINEELSSGERFESSPVSPYKRILIVSSTRQASEVRFNHMRRYLDTSIDMLSLPNLFIIAGNIRYDFASMDSARMKGNTYHKVIIDEEYATKEEISKFKILERSYIEDHFGVEE